MKSFFAFLGLSLLMIALAQMPAPSAAKDAQGQDLPDHTCTCQKCASGGGDVNGQCNTVCKDKTVYQKGSEPYDYCKAAARRFPGRNIGRVPRGTLRAQ
jgi:hypothetical protein